MAFRRSVSLTLPIAPLVTVVGLVPVFLAALLTPAGPLAGFIRLAGLPLIWRVFGGEIDLILRLTLALSLGLFLGTVLWSVTYLLVGARTWTFSHTAPTPPRPVPKLRRADAHPDNPVRAPLLAATDLGTPFLDVRATPKSEPRDALAETVVPIAAPESAPKPAPVLAPIIDEVILPVTPTPTPTPAAEEGAFILPRDLDLPLCSYDPAALPTVPMAPSAPVAPLAKAVPVREPAPLAPGERIETFELTPMVRAEAPVRTAVQPSIGSLIDRLERGARTVRTPAGTIPPASLEETLTSLRRLAMRA